MLAILVLNTPSTAEKKRSSDQETIKGCEDSKETQAHLSHKRNTQEEDKMEKTAQLVPI